MREVTPDELGGFSTKAVVIGPFGSSLKTSDFTDSGVPLIFVRDIRARDFSKPRAYVSEEKASDLRAHIAIPGDLVVTKMGDPPGDVAIYDGPVPAVITADCIRLRPASSYDARYLLHAFQAPHVRQQVLGITSGAAQKKVSLDRFRHRVAVPVPSLLEQRRIAGILDRASAIGIKRRQVLGQLEVLTQSIFDDMFGEDLPTAPLGELAETRLGKMLDAKRQTGEHRRPYLRNANVQWFRFELEDLLEMDFNEKDRITLALQEGDVLVCEGGQPGRSAIWRGELDECYFQKALHRVRLGDELEPEYFVRAMKKIVDSNGLKDYVTSSTIAHLTGEKFRTLPIPVPQRERQREFAERIARVKTQITSERRALAAGDALFVSLQSRAFRGEL